MNVACVWTRVLTGFERCCRLYRKYRSRMTTQIADFSTYLAESGRVIEEALDTLLNEDASGGETFRPERLLAAIRHGVLGGGKRLRPFLVMESAVACGADRHAAIRAGAALELVHCYSLIHDDLPAMDDDDLRRGRPTVHRAYDEATAILAGDSLLTLAFDVLSNPLTHSDAEVRLALISGLARAAGIGGMAGGQALDLEAEGRFAADKQPQSLTAEAIRRLQAMKTGALLAYAVDAGALIAKAGDTKRLALKDYGRCVGAAFQIADDILDVESDAATLGKAAGKDAGMGKGTLIALLGLDAAKAERDRLARNALEALAGFGAEADGLRATARFIVERRF